MELEAPRPQLFFRLRLPIDAEDGPACRVNQDLVPRVVERIWEDALQPPRGIYIWLFRYRSRQWLARSNVANIGYTLSDVTHHTQVITGFVGQFGFQTLISRWPQGRYLELRAPQVKLWMPATRLIWPSDGSLIDWPPEYLADDTIEDFMDRWNSGIPLTRPVV